MLLLKIKVVVLRITCRMGRVNVLKKTENIFRSLSTFILFKIIFYLHVWIIMHQLIETIYFILEYKTKYVGYCLQNLKTLKNTL